MFSIQFDIKNTCNSGMRYQNGTAAVISMENDSAESNVTIE